MTTIGSLFTGYGGLDMIVATPGRMRVSNRTATDFRAWYTHAGAPISEEDLA